jgi:tRNA (guanine37-N1)-methyltransferase
MTVPADLLSGDHQRVSAWRARAGRTLTRQRRPDLLEGEQDDAEHEKRKRK